VSPGDDREDTPGSPRIIEAPHGPSGGAFCLPPGWLERLFTCRGNGGLPLAQELRCIRVTAMARGSSTRLRVHRIIRVDY